MSAKLISLKVPVYTLERIDAEAKRLGITRTQLLIMPFTDQKGVEQIMPHLIPGNAVMVDPRAVYSRPAHDPTCRCYVCRPPSKTSPSAT